MPGAKTLPLKKSISSTPQQTGIHQLPPSNAQAARPPIARPVYNQTFPFWSIVCPARRSLTRKFVPRGLTGDGISFSPLCGADAIKWLTVLLFFGNSSPFGPPNIVQGSTRSLTIKLSGTHSTGLRPSLRLRYGHFLLVYDSPQNRFHGWANKLIEQ